MIKYEATSFIGNDYYNNKYGNIIGNPATIFILEAHEDFDKKLMSSIAIKEESPMCCFIKNIKDSDYNIFFYNLDGSQAYMCGHGLLATSYILNKHFKLNDINFYYDTSKFKQKIDNNLIKVSVDDKAMIEMNMFHYKLITSYDKNINLLMEYLGITKEDIKDIVCGEEYYDLTFILKDAELLRKLKPNFEELAIILNEEHMNIRNLCVSAESKDVDFETRVFCPHDNLNEDIACGSSNLTISRYWHDITKKSEFTILFPYHIYDGKVGGVQFIRIDNNNIFIGGYCK